MPTLLPREFYRDASAHLDRYTREAWASLIRGLDRYARAPERYRDLEAKIAAAEGTIKARMLNAVIDYLEDEVGPGEAQLSGGDRGLRYSQPAERYEMVLLGFRVLYDYAAVEASYVTDFNYSAAAAQRMTRPPCGFCYLHGLASCIHPVWRT